MYDTLLTTHVIKSWMKRGDDHERWIGEILEGGGGDLSPTESE